MGWLFIIGVQLIFRALKSLIGEHSRRPENVTYNNNNNIGAVLLISLKTDKQKKFLYSCEINTSLSDSLIDHVYSQKNNGPKLFVQKPPVPQKFLVFFFEFICIRKKIRNPKKWQNEKKKIGNGNTTTIIPFFFTGRVCGYLGEMVVQLITHTNILCKSSAGYLPAVMIFWMKTKHKKEMIFTTTLAAVKRTCESSSRLFSLSSQPPPGG